MKDLTIFVKLNASATAVHPAIGFVEESYRTQCEHFYFTSDTDRSSPLWLSPEYLYTQQIK